MFNLPNLSKESIISWLQTFEQQIRDKFSVTNKKIDSLVDAKADEKIKELEETLANLAHGIIDVVYPVGSFIVAEDNPGDFANFYDKKWFFTGYIYVDDNSGDGAEYALYQRIE